MKFWNKSLKFYKVVSIQVKKPQWVLVNKQWCEWYLAITYKEVTLDVDSDVLYEFVDYDFQPGKFVRSITVANLCTEANSVFPPYGGDPLYMLMRHCPNVKHVKLPPDMEGSRCEEDWKYFSKALVYINTLSAQIAQKVR